MRQALCAVALVLLAGCATDSEPARHSLGMHSAQTEAGEGLRQMTDRHSGVQLWVAEQPVLSQNDIEQAEVLVGGAAIHRLNENQVAIWRGRTVGIIFQFFQLLPTLSVLENVMLPMDFAHIYTSQLRRQRAINLLEQVSMAEHAHKLPSAISGGQQQRVAIARALATAPPSVVADEPTGNLDSKMADTVFHLFASLVHHGKTIVMVTHDQDLARRVSRTLVMVDGAIMEAAHV